MPLTSAQLKAVLVDGLIHEDVMDAIQDVSQAIDNPLTAMLGDDSISNSTYSWTQDALQPVDLSNAVVDGSDPDQDNTNLGDRVQNQAQISQKVVFVSSRADASDTIGRARETIYQNMMRMKELTRDMEAITLTSQGSVPDDGVVQPGLIGAHGAWLTSNTDRGVGGADGGFNSGTGAVDAPTIGTERALSETTLRTVCNDIWKLGGMPSVAMSVPDVISRISEYAFTDTARGANMDTDVGQGLDASVFKGAVNIYVLDFGIRLQLVPNRIMQEEDTNNANLYLMDSRWMRWATLRGARSERLAKTGLSEKWMLTKDWGWKELNQESQGVIADIDPTAAMIG